jgi:hypothetical protein
VKRADYHVIPATYDVQRREYRQLDPVFAATEAEALRVLRTTNAVNGTRGDLVRLADGAEWHDAAHEWVRA